MFPVPTPSPHQVDELSFLARRIPTNGTPWIEERSFHSFFLFSPSLTLPLTFFSNPKMGDPPNELFFFSFYALDMWLTSRHVSLLAWVPFCPEIIYFVPVQVQYILNELNLSYFLTPEFLVKILSLGVTRRPLPRKL